MGGRGHGLVGGNVGAPAVGAHCVDEEEEGFKYYVAGLLVTNTIIGPVAQKLYAKADRARAEGVSELGRAGNRGKAKKKHA